MIRKVILTLLLGLVLFFGLQMVLRNEPAYRFHAFETESGWGYTIVKEGQVLIYQPFVPVVAGQQVFKRKKDALNTAALVVSRLKRGESPVLSLQDLQDLKVVIVPELTD